MPAALSSTASSTAPSSGTNPFRDLALAQQQQEGLAAAASDPLRYYWLKQDSIRPGAAWTPLRKRDSAALEAALAKADTAPLDGGNAELPITVLAEGGRYQVILKERRLHAIYWDKDERQVLRSSWFSKPATNLPGAGGFVPYGEADAAAIESLYQGVLDDTMRSLAAGSFFEASTHSSSSSSSSSSAGADALEEFSSGAGAHTTTSTACSGGSGKNVLLRKELVLEDKIHKVVVTVKDISTLADSKQHRRGSTASTGSGDGSTGTGGASVTLPCSAYAVKTLPGVEIQMHQQRVSYGIGVLHNRVMRRGYVDETVTQTGAAAAATPSSPLEVNELEEDDDLDREPDHLCFVVHGIGEKIWSSDKVQGMLSLRASVEQLRVNALAQRVKHLETPSRASGAFPTGVETTTSTRATATAGTIGEEADKTTRIRKKTRTEFLPIEWFDALRGDTADEQGDVMRRIQRVTLDTVPLFRQLANDCVLDVLLYMNPRYRQKIVTAVANRINAAYALFCEHHPGFHGKKKVSVIGHSLGSVVLFDLLAHQTSSAHQKDGPLLSPADAHIDFPQLTFPVDLFLTLGSPIGLFLCVREQDFPPDFRFPTTSRFLNIFHPLDPIAYRLEPLLQPALSQLPPALVPHHEGVGSKTFVTKAREQKRLVSGSLSALSLSVSAGAKILMGSLSSLAMTKPAAPPGGYQEMLTLDTSIKNGADVAGMTPPIGVVEDEVATKGAPDVASLRINNGQRVDYALQEMVSEQINEYVSSIAAHSCYFASPDVAYFITQLVYESDKAAAGDTGTTGTVGDDEEEAMASDKEQEEASLVFSLENSNKKEVNFAT